MSVFKLGQKVRIKATPSVNPQYANREAVIFAFGSSLPLDPPFKSRPQDDCVVSIGGELFGACQDMLEPLTPPGTMTYEQFLALPVWSGDEPVRMGVAA